MSAAKKKNMKKFGRLLEQRISGTARPILFKFDTLGNETVGHLRRDFDSAQQFLFYEWVKMAKSWFM